MHVDSKKKQRGRPFPPGVSGNPAGRPRGSLNKLSLAVIEGVRWAEEELARPILLDKNFPFNAWGDCYEQFGRIFRKDNLTEKYPGTPSLPQPEMLNRQRPWQEIILKSRHFYIQDGWLFQYPTGKAAKSLPFRPKRGPACKHRRWFGQKFPCHSSLLCIFSLSPLQSVRIS
jgi:hypothetical protein